MLLLTVVAAITIFFFVNIKHLEGTTLVTNEEISSSILSAAKEVVSKNKKNLRGSERSRINILLLGMGGEGHRGKYLTDTIILASINPKTYETSLVSIPRDLYVEIPDSKVYTKINAVYAYGKRNLEKEDKDAIQPIKETVEEITGQPVDYYLTINFEGFKQIIDELGGIIIQVEEDIVDHRYPGPGTSYETFEIKEGTHLINGDVALKYARVRHVAGGDFSRLKRQQEIISSAKRRALSIENFVNPVRLGSLIEILGENIQTNIQLDEIPSFIELFNNINTYEMTTKVLDAWSPDSLLAVSHVLLGNVNAFILVPRTGNYQEIQELIANIFDLEKRERKQQEIETESAKILVVSESFKNQFQVKSIFSKMGYSVEVDDDSVFSEKCKNDITVLDLETNKYHTLNDLTNKFKAELKDIPREDETEFDIIVCFPKEKLESLESQINQTTADEFEGGLILDDSGNILYNED